MMGGRGTRLNTELPKQYTLVYDKPLFSYIVEKIDKFDMIDKLVIVSHEDWIQQVQELCARSQFKKVSAIVSGGDTRSESVKNGLMMIANFPAKEDDIVLIHDVTHPYVDIEGTKKVIETVKQYGAATLCACQYDTCYSMDENCIVNGVIPRKEIVSAGSPEAFLFGDIYKIFMNSTSADLVNMTCAGALALAHGLKMHIVPTNIFNLKITFKEDLELFKILAKTYFFPFME